MEPLDLLQDYKLLEKVFTKIEEHDLTKINRRYNYDFSKLRFEYVSIVFGWPCDLRNIEQLRTLGRKDEAAVYAYTEAIPDDCCSDLVMDVLRNGRHNSEFPGRLRVTLDILLTSNRISKTNNLLAKFEVPDVQHIPFPKKDEDGNWMFNFLGEIGTMTKAAR